MRIPSPTVDHKIPAAKTKNTPYLWASALTGVEDRIVILGPIKKWYFNLG